MIRKNEREQKQVEPEWTWEFDVPARWVDLSAEPFPGDYYDWWFEIDHPLHEPPLDAAPQRPPKDRPESDCSPFAPKRNYSKQIKQNEVKNACNERKNSPFVIFCKNTKDSKRL